MFNNKKFRMFLLGNKLMYWIVFKVFPNLEATIIKKNLEEEINTLKQKQEIDFFDPNIKIENLENLQRKEMERNKVIEDKAKLTIVGITIAISTFSIGIVIYNSINASDVSQKNFLSLFLLIVFIISFIYLVLSGLSALTSLSLKEVHDIYLDDELELLTKDESFKISRMIKNLRLNYHVTPQKEIYLIASYQNIKNGILWLLIGILFFGTCYLFKDLPNNHAKDDGNNKSLIRAKVIGVVDPQTLTVSVNGKNQNIVLYFIDVPGVEKPFYKVSYAYTEELTLNKMIYIHFFDLKNNEAVVYLNKNNKVSLNQLLIKNGLAKVKNAKSNLKDQNQLLEKFINEEKQAKQNKYGLWFN